MEYFGDPSLLALTYASADADSGVNQISYYTRNLFASTVAKASGARQNPATQSSASQSGSGAHGLSPLNLPAEMLPPGSTSASVDRTGRTSTGKSRAQGSHNSSIKFTLPSGVPPGNYRIVTTVSDGQQSKTIERPLQVV